MRYRARPIGIDAIEWDGDMEDIPQRWLRTGTFSVNEDGLSIHTLRGWSDVHIGDHIVRRRSGELYPVDPLTFHEHYEAVSE